VHEVADFITADLARDMKNAAVLQMWPRLRKAYAAVLRRANVEGGGLQGVFVGQHPTLGALAKQLATRTLGMREPNWAAFPYLSHEHQGLVRHLVEPFRAALPPLEAGTPSHRSQCRKHPWRYVVLLWRCFCDVDAADSFTLLPDPRAFGPRFIRLDGAALRQMRQRSIQKKPDTDPAAGEGDCAAELGDGGLASDADRAEVRRLRINAAARRRRADDVEEFHQLLSFGRAFGPQGARRRRRFPDVRPEHISSVLTDGYTLHFCMAGRNDESTGDGGLPPRRKPGEGRMHIASTITSTAPALITRGLFWAKDVFLEDPEHFVLAADDPGRVSHCCGHQQPRQVPAASYRLHHKFEEIFSHVVPQSGQHAMENLRRVDLTVGVLRRERGMQHRQRKLENMKKAVPQWLPQSVAETESRLASPGRTVAQYIEFIRSRTAIANALYDFYASAPVLKMGYQRLIDEQRFTARLASGLQGKQRVENTNRKKPVVLFFGGAKFDHASKGAPPALGIGLARRLSQHIIVLLTDEFRTSKMCIRCHDESAPLKEHLLKEDDIRADNVEAVNAELAWAHQRRAEQEAAWLATPGHVVHSDHRLPPPTPIQVPLRPQDIAMLRRCLPYRVYGPRPRDPSQRRPVKYRLRQHVLHARLEAIYKMKRCPHCGLVVQRDVQGFGNIMCVGKEIVTSASGERPVEFRRPRGRSAADEEHDDHVDDVIYDFEP
jgi:hypothetical protein